jgi:hypothetical protein
VSIEAYTAYVSGEPAPSPAPVAIRADAIPPADHPDCRRIRRAAFTSSTGIAVEEHADPWRGAR